MRTSPGNPYYSTLFSRGGTTGERPPAEVTRRGGSGRQVYAFGMVRRAVIVLVAGVGAAVLWGLAGLPPPRAALRHGFGLAGGPTGRTAVVEGVEFVELAPGPGGRILSWAPRDPRRSGPSSSIGTEH